MKSLMTYLVIATLGMFVFINTTAALERNWTFELAESGVMIEFPMTSEKIIPEEAENTRSAAIYAKYAEPSKGDLAVFELAESGQIIEFPVIEKRALPEMSDSEIAGLQAF